MYYRLVTEKPILGAGNLSWTLKLPATIGRSSDADVCVEDESISRSHCQLFLGNDESLQVRDLNSLNGTFVNGERIRKVHSLFPGDVIQVGAAFLRIEYASDTDPGKPPAKRRSAQNNVTQPMKAHRFEEAAAITPPDSSKRWWEFWK
jgi:predicted component of type VI protein secretion system